MWSFHMLLRNIRLQPLTWQVIIFSGHIRTQVNWDVAPVLRQKYKLFFTWRNNNNLLQLWSGSCRSGCRYEVLASPWSIWKFTMAFTQQSFISLFGISDREKTWIDIFPLHLESDQYNGIATWTICGESFEYVPNYEMKIWSLPNWKKNFSNNENFKLMSLDEGKLREWDENTFHTPFKTSITWNREIAW